jgi:hypothetical protein
MTQSQQQNWSATIATLVEKDIFPKLVHRLCLYGPPATGKSALAYHLFGSSVERVTLHQQVSPEDLIGCLGLTSDNGATVTTWQDGPVIRAMRGDGTNGFPLVLDEIDQVSGDVRCILHAVCDDWPNIAITLPDGEVVKPKPGFCVIATTNQSPNTLPEALQSRFDLIVYACSPCTGILESLPEDYRETATRAYDRAEVVRWNPSVTIRSLFAMAQLERELGREQAAQLVFGDELGTEIISGIATQ